tara:strand:+ start:262 stop:492 length:231 start_codon:yes stop_codon:yes gene_type:complete
MSKTRTVTIELAWRVETTHEVEVPCDGDINPDSLQDWLRDCDEHTPDVNLMDETFWIADCYAWQITDNETGEVWQK